MKKHPRHLGLAARGALVAAAMIAGQAAAAAIAVTNNASLNHGVAVVGAQADAANGRVAVEARVNRSRASGVLAPQTLRVALVGADGAVRAQAEQIVGPAQLPRRNSRDAHLSLSLAVEAAPSDRVVIDWVKPARPTE
jgi:hypothetical protein